MKEKTTAGIFALLLGGIGIHKFYLGKTGKGILYILFCWTFIPAIVGLIEGISYLSMTQDAFDAKYNGVLSNNRVAETKIATETVETNSKKWNDSNERLKELYKKMEVQLKTDREMANADYSAGKITRDQFQEKIKWIVNEETTLKADKKDSGL